VKHNKTSSKGIAIVGHGMQHLIIRHCNLLVKVCVL